jgi:hypothetical protein
MLAGMQRLEIAMSEALEDNPAEFARLFQALRVKLGGSYSKALDEAVAITDSEVGTIEDVLREGIAAQGG